MPEASMKRQVATGLPMASLLFVFGLSTVFLFLSLALNPVTGQSSPAGSGSCHLRELDLCAASMLVFAQGREGLATSDAEITKQCVNLKEAGSCFKNYTTRCLTKMQRELVTFASTSSLQLLDEYCTKGSKLRQSYLKHSQCLNQIQKRQEHKGCMRDLQGALELLTSSQSAASIPKQDLQKQAGTSAQGATNGKRLQMACCAYRRFESCLGGQTEKRCGKETIDFAQTVMRRVTSRLPETVCRNFKPDGQECKALLPKNGATPRGSKSNSILSRLLSAYSGL